MIASWPSCWVASRNSALAVMSPTPAEQHERQRAARGTRSERRPTSATATTSTTDASRAATSGVRPASSRGAVEQHEEAARSAVPATSAGAEAGRPGARAADRQAALGGHQDDGDQREHDARRRRPGPMRFAASRPASTGTAAAVTAVTGAITLITPRGQGAEEDHQPGGAGQARRPRPSQVGRPWPGRRARGAAASSATSPATCDSATTPNTERPPAGQAAEEVRRAVDDGRAEREHAPPRRTSSMVSRAPSSGAPWHRVLADHRELSRRTRRRRAASQTRARADGATGQNGLPCLAPTIPTTPSRSPRSPRRRSTTR